MRVILTGHWKNKKSSTKEQPLPIPEPHPSMSLNGSLIPCCRCWSLSLHLVPSRFFNRAFFCHNPGLRRPLLTAEISSGEADSSPQLEIRQNSLAGHSGFSSPSSSRSATAAQMSRLPDAAATGAGASGRRRRFLVLFCVCNSIRWLIRDSDYLKT